MRKTALATAWLAIVLSCSFVICSQPALAKRWTVTQRIEKLSAEIDEGRKANELTTKQVESLKKDIAAIKERIAKMKAKNGDKLSLPDTKKLQDDMTDLSVKIVRTRLNNVYSD